MGLFWRIQGPIVENQMGYKTESDMEINMIQRFIGFLGQRAQDMP